jgi:hypothetical protein
MAMYEQEYGVDFVQVGVGKIIVTEQEVEQKNNFMQIADELGVNPSSLSRWLAGMGSLNQDDIHALATNISPTVYTLLHLPWPNNP